MLKSNSISLLRIKRKLEKFYKILANEYKCSTPFKCRKFITKNLRYCRDGCVAYCPVKKLRDILERCGLKYLGSGASRFVVGSGKFAIKIEKWNPDYEFGVEDADGEPSANESELEAYRIIQQDPLRKLLVVPLVSHFKMNGDLVLVYPQLDSYDELFADPDKSHLLEDAYNAIRETACNWLFTDSCSNNFGLYKNVLFFLDFNIECDHPLEYDDADLQKDLEKAMEEFKMQTENIHRTKQYIREMKAIA